MAMADEQTKTKKLNTKSPNVFVAVFFLLFLRVQHTQSKLWTNKIRFFFRIVRCQWVDVDCRHDDAISTFRRSDAVAAAMAINSVNEDL